MSDRHWQRMTNRALRAFDRQREWEAGNVPDGEEEPTLLQALIDLLEHVQPCNSQNPDWLSLEECPPFHRLECSRCAAVRRARYIIEKQK